MVIGVSSCCKYLCFIHLETFQNQSSPTNSAEEPTIYGETGVLQERSADGGTVLKTYAPHGEMDSTNGIAVPRYYTRDHLGSVREVVASDGSLSSRYDYTPYGERTRISGTYEGAKGFTGHDYLADSGLILTRFRAYDPLTGRWLSPDPIGENGGVNLYAYVEGDPLKFFDPDGRDAMPTGDGNYRFDVNPRHYGANSLSDVFRLMNGRHVNHPNYSGQCATGAQAMTGYYGKDGLWRDAAPGSLSKWFQGPSVSSGGVRPGTMIAKGWPDGKYGGANGHTGIYMGGNKMFAQNGDGLAPNGRPFVEQDIDPSGYFEVRSKTPYDKDPTKCSTP